MTTIRQSQNVWSLQDRAGTFVVSVMRRTVAALKALPDLDVSDWINRLERNHPRDQPIDRLLVAAFPELRPPMVRHYELDGPCLFEIHDPETLASIDVRMAQFIKAVAQQLSVNSELRNFSLTAPQDLLGLMLPNANPPNGKRR